MILFDFLNVVVYVDEKICVKVMFSIFSEVIVKMFE